MDEAARGIEVEGRGEDRGLDGEDVIRDGFTRGTEEGNGVVVGTDVCHEVDFNAVVIHIREGLNGLNGRDGGHFYIQELENNLAKPKLFRNSGEQELENKFWLTPEFGNCLGIRNPTQNRYASLFHPYKFHETDCNWPDTRVRIKRTKQLLLLSLYDQILPGTRLQA